MLGLLVAVLVAFGLGTASAWFAVRPPTPVGELTVGAWHAAPRSGTSDDDPYSRARLARGGELPLGSAEGLTLTAETDSAGLPLRGECTYRIAGRVPTARLWTLGVENETGAPLVGDVPRRALGSDELLRNADGTFTVIVAPEVQAGNWLSSVPGVPIRVVTRLYDTTSRTATAISSLAMPTIQAVACP